MGNNKDDWETVINQDHLPWVQVSDLQEWGNEVPKQYGVTSIPAGYIIDPEGYLLYKVSNVQELAVTLAKLGNPSTL